MLYAAAVILIVLGLVFPSNKLVHCVFLLYIWVLFAFNTWNADYEAYYAIYERIGRGDLWGTTVSEEGFVFLCYFFRHFLHFSYQQFLISVASGCTLLLAVVVNLYSKRPNTVLSLFILYPYWIMITQYRSYIATLLVLLGIYFLYYNESGSKLRMIFHKHELRLHNESIRTFLFFFFVILGGFFHRTAFLFLVFYIVKKVNFRTLIVITLGAAAVFLVIRVPAVASLMSIFISREKINDWLLADGIRTVRGTVFLVSVRVITVIIEYAMLRSYRKSSTVSPNYMHFVELVFKSTILSISFLALEVFVKDYERLSRVTLFLSYALFADFTQQRRISQERVPLSYLSYYGFYLLHTAYYFYAFGGYMDIAFAPAFERNALLG